MDVYNLLFSFVTSCTTLFITTLILNFSFRIKYIKIFGYSDKIISSFIDENFIKVLISFIITYFSFPFPSLLLFSSLLSIIRVRSVGRLRDGWQFKPIYPYFKDEFVSFWWSPMSWYGILYWTRKLKSEFTSDEIFLVDM